MINPLIVAKDLEQIAHATEAGQQRATLLAASDTIRRITEALQKIADSDHAEDGGFECGHADIAEAALK